MEADPSFIYKLCVECGLDAAIILSVNLATRKDRFLSQLEFVGCQVRLRTAQTARSSPVHSLLSFFWPSSKPGSVAPFSDALSLRSHYFTATTTSTQPEPVCIMVL